MPNDTLVLTRSSRPGQTAQRQGARSFRPRRDLAFRRDRPPLRLRRHSARPDPGQRRGPEPNLRFLVRANSTRAKNHFVTADFARFPTELQPFRAATGRALDDRAQDQTAAGRVRRARLSRRLRLEGLSGDGQRSAGTNCQLACTGVGVTGAHLHALDQERSRPRS